MPLIKNHTMPRFFDRYILQVEENDLMEAFSNSLHILQTLDVKALEATGHKTYAPGKWTIPDILQHIIDNERIQSYRALRFARNDQTVLPGYDEELFAAHTTALNRPVKDLMEELILIRKASIALFQSFDETMANRRGICFNIELSVIDLGFVFVGHQNHHLRVIQEKYMNL